MISTHLEDIREESRADPFTGKIIKARETGKGTDEGSVGGWTHPAHLEKTRAQCSKHAKIKS